MRRDSLTCLTAAVRTLDRATAYEAVAARLAELARGRPVAPLGGMALALDEAATAAITPATLAAWFETRRRPGERKTTGVFYTPPVVVAAMARAALGEYLGDTPAVRRLLATGEAGTRRGVTGLARKLRRVRIVDPAVGAGAFPMAMLELLVRCRRGVAALPDTPEVTARLRREVVTENLFGMDVDPEAVALTELRLRLAIAAAGGGFPERAGEGNWRVGDSLRDRLPGEAEGFDVVIGNPPYVSYGLRGTATLTAATRGELKRRYPESAQYKISMYALFMERAAQLARADGGIQSLIVPDSFLTGKYFSGVRRMLLRQRLAALTVYGGALFAAAVGVSVSYLAVRRTPKASDRVRIGGGGAEEFSMRQRELTAFNDRFCLFFDAETPRLVRKIMTGSRPLGELVRFASGLIGRHGQRAIVSETARAGSWKPGLSSGRAVRRFAVAPADCYLNCAREEIKSGWGKVDYFQDKILLRQTGDAPVAALDTGGLLVLNHLHVGNAMGPEVSLKAMVAILNSRLMRWFYQTVAMEKGRALAQLDLDTVRALPIRVPTAAAGLERLHDRAAAGGDDAELDAAVCRLYGLTAAEARRVCTG